LLELEVPMRLLSVVLSFLVTITVVLASLSYLERRIGEHRIYVQDRWLSSGDSVAEVRPVALGQ
jgi:hypothetical protein